MAKKKKQKATHSYFKDSYNLHAKVGSYDGGACLSGHLYKWTARNSCSYRWQGIKKAKENPTPYDSHGKAYCHLNGAGFPALAVLGIKNFNNGFMPYSNQVHHVLPNSVLRNGIDETTKSKANLIKDICDGLLTEKYNINFKDNMLILAVKWKDACQIGLPTHLGDHPGYSAKIKARVIKALQPYAQVVDDEEDHDEPDYLDLKDELKAISDSMYGAIVAHGQTSIKGSCSSAPVSVNQLPASVYAVLL